ncbi:MAG: Xaa-Pro peptidase family protein [Anderseniella sp.]
MSVDTGITYAAFPQAEHRARLAQARALLAQAGIDFCISMAPENLYYYGGYDSWVSVNSPQAMVFATAGGEPAIMLRDTDISLVRETSWITDVRAYRLMADDVPGLIAALACEKGLSGGKVGIEVQSYAVPYALGNRIAHAIAPADIVDVTGLLGMPRLIKSPTELGFLRTAGGYAAKGIEAARRAAKPGMTEIELAGEVEHAMRAAGSDYWSIPTELASGDRTAGGHATARERVMQSGDLVHMEFAGVCKRYHATAVHTFSLGDPGQRARDIYALGQASLAAGIAAVRPGVCVADVEEASLVPLRAHGLEEAATMRFGYGIGAAYPPIWLEPLQIARGSDQILEPGMVFVLHGYLQLIEEKLGVIVGGTYHLGHDGLEMIAGTGEMDLEIL